MSSAISRITPKLDLTEIYANFEVDPAKAIQYGNFSAGKFLKPIPITIQGHVENGIITSEYNGGKSYTIGIKLDTDVVEAFETFEFNLEEIVRKENDKAASVGDFDSVWEYKPFIKDNVLDIKLKMDRDGKFKAAINRTFNMSDVSATYVPSNTKVTVHGNLIWWANAESAILGASFTLKKMEFIN